MIVQPTSTNPRGRLGRVLRAAGFLAPPLLLLVVIGAGVVGPQPEPTAPPTAQPTAPPASPPATDAVAVGTPPPAALAAFPDVAAGLSVRTVAEAQPLLAQADGSPIAVAGWLGALQPDPGCTTSTGDTRGILSPLCERSLQLEASPPGTGPGAHLHVHVAPGVRLPPPFEWPGAQRAEAIPVVLVGRAVEPTADCAGSTRGCGEQLELDLVTWATDGPFTPGVIFDAGLEVPPPAIAYRRQAEAESLAIGWSGTILVSAVVRPSTVAAIDPDAAAAMARAPRPAGLVWYVRGLETTYGPGRFPPGDYPARVRWVVLDETTGSPVVTGITGQPDTTTATALSMATPRAVVNLRVRSVPAFLDAVAAGRADRVVALRGYLRAWADPRACTHPVPGLPANGCAREAVLADGPWTGGPDLVEPPPASLHAVVPAGVPVPESAVDIEGGPADAVPVVLIARLGPSLAGCAPDLSGCRAPLTIERVTWAAGSRLAIGREVARPLSVAPDDPVALEPELIANRRLGPLTTLLRVALVDGGDLVALDPRAARAVRANGGHRGPVWYLRGLRVPYDPLLDPPYGRQPASVRWAVLDPVTGRMLATNAG